jgi:hypothetical protein
MEAEKRSAITNRQVIHGAITFTSPLWPRSYTPCNNFGLRCIESKGLCNFLSSLASVET